MQTNWIKNKKHQRLNIGDEYMKISWIKYEKDEDSFKMPENLGLDVFKLQDLDNTDNKIKELIDKKYHTIIVTNEVASFSEDMIKKYKYSTDINIIILPRKD